MSSSKSLSIAAMILCVFCIMSFVGSRSVVEAGVVFRGTSLSYNRPSPLDGLLSSATSIYTSVLDGKISSEEGRRQGQQLIQANKAANNLAIINGIRG